MGEYYEHACNQCSYFVATSGPWEFYRDDKGKREFYGHPSPLSEEAIKRGVWGMSADLFCPHCGVLYDIIVVEFREPQADKASAWKAYLNRDEQITSGDITKCPGCGETDLVLEPLEEREVSCPHCKKGKLMGRREIMI